MKGSILYFGLATVVMFAEVLRDAGYSTAYIGKWHLLGENSDRPIPRGEMRYGFDEVFFSNNCHVDFRTGKCFYWNEEGQKVFFLSGGLLMF